MYGARALGNTWGVTPIGLVVYVRGYKILFISLFEQVILPVT
jgi:hypothetical protein